MICFGCKQPLGEGHEPETKFSAYGFGCEPSAPSWRVPLRGNMSQCVKCHEVFTTTRSFDSHHHYVDGALVCKDPRRMFDARHRRRLVLTPRGWAKNPELSGFNTFERQERLWLLRAASR